MFCTDCGRSLGVQALFCDRCGGRVAQVVSDEVRPRPLRRFCARLLDTFLFIPFYVPLAFALITFLHNWFGILCLVVWVITMPFVTEAFFLSRFGATPGKWMLGLSVETLDGKKLTFQQALSRSIQVFVFGRGLFIPVVSWITHFIALSKLGKNGTTSWDEDQFRVLCHQMTTARLCVLGALLLGFTYIGMTYDMQDTTPRLPSPVRTGPRA